MFSIVIPCYNEKQNLKYLFEKMSAFHNKHTSQKIEIILVDNGSIDGSELEMSVLINLHEHLKGVVKILTLNTNEGYGNGILQGLSVASGDWLCWTHADLQTDIEDTFRAYEKIINCSDRVIVKGNRIGRNIVDFIFTFGMSLISSFALGRWLSDVNAQPKMFHRTFYNEMKNPPRDFSLDLYLLNLAKVKGYEIQSIPVRFNRRIHGEAKGGGSLKTKWPLMKRTFKYIFTLRKSKLIESNEARIFN